MNKIIIHFPVDVEFPPGFEQTLSALINMVCEFYETKNPTRSMWPAGHGFYPFLDKDGKPVETDYTTYAIDCAEREANEKDLRKRGLLKD